MKTTHTNNKLAFAKNAVAELNDNDLNSIHGGSWTVVVDYVKDKINDMMQPQI